MIIVLLSGGIGNQMFQYALGRHLAIKHNTTLKLLLNITQEKNARFATFIPRKRLKLHTRYSLDVFNIDNGSPYLFSLLIKPFKTLFKGSGNRGHVAIEKLGYTVIQEKYFHYNPSVLQKTPESAYLIGYWQSFLYFKDIEHILRKEFTFKTPVASHSLHILQKIQTTTSVCLHVRRGDYLLPANNYLLNTISDKPNYFIKSAEYLVRKIDDKSIHFFVFSNDIAWCIENIKLPYPTTFVPKDHAGKKAGNHLQLMKTCKHFIISNSSFSWWAAWLSENKHKIVVVPKKWFNLTTYNTKDLTPPEWIRFEYNEAE